MAEHLPPHPSSSKLPSLTQQQPDSGYDKLRNDVHGLGSELSRLGNGLYQLRDELDVPVDHVNQQWDDIQATFAAVQGKFAELAKMVDQNAPQNLQPAHSSVSDRMPGSSGRREDIGKKADRLAREFVAKKTTSSSHVDLPEDILRYKAKGSGADARRSNASWLRRRAARLEMLEAQSAKGQRGESSASAGRHS
ncbi:hypothetical protein CF319_g6264 [Tilletia indica]|nr:hypothetical protein CF319_g6264 [Tilletia indica]KAE8227380.1 hypothetical protein CF326_g7576 [Tilletia indica]